MPDTSRHHRQPNATSPLDDPFDRLAALEALDPEDLAALHRGDHGEHIEPRLDLEHLDADALGLLPLDVDGETPAPPSRTDLATLADLGLPAAGAQQPPSSSTDLPERSATADDARTPSASPKPAHALSDQPTSAEIAESAGAPEPHLGSGPASVSAPMDQSTAPRPRDDLTDVAEQRPSIGTDDLDAQPTAPHADSDGAQPRPPSTWEETASAKAPLAAISDHPGTEPLGDEPSSPEAQVFAYLHERGRLTGGDLARARKLADDSGDPLRTMLVRLGLVSERDMAKALADVLDLELVSSDDYPDHPVLDGLFPLRFLKDARVCPLRDDDHGIALAVADPLDPFIAESIRLATARPVRLHVGLPTDIEAAVSRLHEPQPEAPEDADGLESADLGNFSEEDIEHLRDLASEAPVIRLVNQIMQRAVESRASDVHIEPFADELKVRLRVDGILQQIDSPPVRSTAAVISRVKIMAKLNIAERRLPQDGRIPLRIQGKELDLRVSTVPTMFGESVVMRLLDKESVQFDFDALGFDGTPRQRLLKVLEAPFGIFLVTGPTGSGKSTTLYTALSRLNTEQRKIITVEDPVEYQIAGINQIPVKASIGMTFAGALRAIVRQDPDIIMVGEMRDLETARIAVQSALTGHVVLSTLHTNDAASGVTRLLDMGVDDYLLTSTINGILAQRLVRRLCPHCREPYEPMPELAARFIHIADVNDGPIHLYRPGGCRHCNGTGFRGRLVIAEVLVMSDRIRKAVLDHATATQLHQIAVEEDMHTMYQDGLRKALQGLTTVDEVMRVAEED
jgi:general secretion pathway protein E